MLEYFRNLFRGTMGSMSNEVDSGVIPKEVREPKMEEVVRDVHTANLTPDSIQIKTGDNQSSISPDQGISVECDDDVGSTGDSVDLVSPSSQSESDSGDSSSSRGSANSEDLVTPEVQLVQLEGNHSICMVCLCAVDTAVDVSVRCTGQCGNQFHQSCLEPEEAAVDYKCDSCKFGPLCFICQKPSGETSGELVSCGQPLCRKEYHIGCLKKCYTKAVTFDAAGVVTAVECPMHHCTTCVAELKLHDRAMKSGPLISCAFCPTAYHKSEEHCLPAGVEKLNDSLMICCAHFDEKSTGMKHVNVNYCFVCGKGGDLVCCEVCPAAVHPTCLPSDKLVVRQRYFCRWCRVGKRARVGDFVWVKLGNYRFWPSQVVSLDDIPATLANKDHQVGDFPVKFFGSNDYTWTSACRSFSFQSGDTTSRQKSATGSTDKLFAKAMLEASEAFRLYTAERVQNLSAQLPETDSSPKPPAYKHIKVNRATEGASKFREPHDEVHGCDCNQKQDQFCDDRCVNRCTNTECYRSCSMKEKCQNQRFQRCQYPKTKVFKTPGRGWGLKTRVNIKRGDFVIEYVGELINEEEFRRRRQAQIDSRDDKFYFLQMFKDRFIDAGPMGNWARFMNHSCEPNCETQLWTVWGDTRVGLFAIKDIAAGEELTFHYNLGDFITGGVLSRCCCKAASCTGFIGSQKKVGSKKSPIPPDPASCASSSGTKTSSKRKGNKEESGQPAKKKAK